jgi:Na+-transporting NADH:ubiquinone oxidoreductase subunit B
MMKALRNILDKQAPLFEEGGKLHRFYYFYEAHDTILFTPGIVTKAASHVRDALDQKRMMISVVIALIPCVVMALFNTGYQANVATAAGATPLADWHTMIYQTLGFSYAASGGVSFWSLENLVLGAIFFVPVWIVGLAAGGFWEVLFSTIRKHPITEGFLVTSTLLPLILPATIPLWQVALGMSFGVVIGKEIFGGVGMNILNPALTARAFLFFAYPAQISGDIPWLPFSWGSKAPQALDSLPHGSSGATYLSHAATGLKDTQGNAISWTEGSMNLGGSDWMNAFYGCIPGSMGETSTLACLLGAALLICMKIGSWRTMLGCVVGTAAMAMVLNGLSASFPDNAMLAMPFWWHFVIGGWAFGAVFMATDPVSSPFSHKGKLIYGFSIGVLAVLVRCVNPAYPEGMMLAILFMNMFAPLIDHFIVETNIKRRMARDVA